MSGIAKLGGTLGAALLAGLLIPGTTATPSAQAQAPQTPTFTKDVLPISSARVRSATGRTPPRRCRSSYQKCGRVRAIRQRSRSGNAALAHRSRIGEYADDPR
jgi:hypothetical protein